MKKIMKIIGIIILFIIAIIVIFVVKFIKDAKIQAADQKLMVKSDDELLGAHLYIERVDKEPVDVNGYFIEAENIVPLVINIHGGAFVAGDADTLDTQSDRISKAWNVNVVTVNYKLLSDKYDKNYAVTEICDVVKYFIENAERYNIDTENIFIMGYSAGGYYAMASTASLVIEDISVKGQILCYAFLSDMAEVYAALTDAQKQNIPPALFILAGDEPIGKSSLDYEALLKENGTDTTVKVYENVKHGFIEENNPEYDVLHSKNKASKSPEAEVTAREAEEYIGEWIHEEEIIQLATACITKCDTFLTNDKQLKQFTEVKVITVDELEV